MAGCKRSLLNTTMKALLAQKGIVLPEAPKRPINAFFLYQEDAGQKIRAENPSIRLKDLTAQTSQNWATLDDETKNYYKMKYKENIEKYNEMLRAFNESWITVQQEHLLERKILSNEDLQSINLKQLRVLFKRPKRPKSAYLLYCSSMKGTEQHELLWKDRLRQWALVWNKLSDLEKEPYVNESKKLSLEYKEKLKCWNEKLEGLGLSLDRRSKTKREVKNLRETEHDAEGLHIL